MDIFSYFQADHAHIERRLQELTARYRDLSAGEVHERASKIFNAIQVHFDKQAALLLEPIKNIEGVEPILAECSGERRTIINEIEDLLNLHVDDADFNKQMKRVLKLIENHISFSDKDLYERIKAVVPADVLTKINDTIADTIFS